MMRYTLEKKYKLSAVGFQLSAILLLSAGNLPAVEMFWQPAGAGILEPEVKHIAIHPQQPSLIYSASETTVYLSENSGKDFRSILNIPSSDHPINKLFIPDSSPDDIYVATEGGVYFSKNRGEPWQKIFQPSEEGVHQARSLAGFNGTVYIGTLKGLYYQKNNGFWWEAGGAGITAKPVFHLAAEEQFLFAATDQKIFRMKKGEDRWEEKFSTPGVENPLAEETVNDEETDSVSGQVKALKMTGDKLYAATGSGIFHSADHGDTWQRLNSDGLPLDTVTSLGVVNDPAGKSWLLVATTDGAYSFDGARWASLYKGLISNAINDTQVTSDGRILAATGRGLMELKKEALTAAALADIEKILEKDPSIQHVQKWAVDHAEVHPNKIKSWRRAAKAKAFLPKLSLDLDREAGEYYHWDTGQNPDNLQKGLDYLDWGMNLSWDFGEWIWNPDQTSIDSRSKLMVELRESVLDQVTRLYFERRRLSAQAAMAEDLQARFDLVMRIEELTALIDGFTGGKFSEAISSQQSAVSFQSSAISSQPSAVSREKRE